MKIVTVKNFISFMTSFFSRQHKLSALVDMAFHKDTNLDFPFILFQLFVCIAEELTSPAVFSLPLAVDSKSYGFSLSKLEKLLSGSEELKEASLDNKLKSLIAGS